MKIQSVVVMSANDVAAMRKAHKEAEAAYFEAKVGALCFVADEMTRTGEEYTAAELAYMSGLSSNEIARQLSAYARASSEAGIGHVNTGIRHTEHQYVRVKPNGEIDPAHTITVIRRETIYKMPVEKEYR